MASKKITISMDEGVAGRVEEIISAAQPRPSVSSYIEQAVREKLRRDGAAEVAKWMTTTDEGRELQADMHRLATMARGRADEQAAA